MVRLRIASCRVSITGDRNMFCRISFTSFQRLVIAGHVIECQYGGSLSSK